ncbi:MAG: DsbA family protein [Heliobacteriaceae bacterium]|jgi:protein-disulfide isomerase/uncharacterized membrane protein|nr:DsbA family protein [Heliobacteriaceae bacterium]
MEGRNRKIWIALIALAGLITTIKLAFIYYDANFNPYALSSFCSVNDFIDCDGIAKTSHSQFFGVPLALWGMFLYAFIFLMLCADKLKARLKIFEVFKNPLDYIAALGILSFAISILLLLVSLFEIKKLCVLCMLTYILNLAIALAAADFRNGGFMRVFRNSVIDFIDGVKRYKAAFIAAVIAAALLLAYTGTSYVLAPQVKRAADFKEFVEAKMNKYKVSGNILGAQNPEVIVDVYSDYKCPICYAHNIMIHKLAKELKNIRVIHHNLPLDMECNKYLQREFHNGSCLAAKYELAAEIQDKAWDMNDILFQYRPSSENEILKLSKIAGFDVERLEKDANSSEVAQKLKSEIDEAYKTGLEGTPVTVIDKETVVGIKPYKDFKGWFVKKGAK